MAQSVYQEYKEKLMLKRMGHSLIDKIRARGYHKDQVYLLLSRELGIEEKHAHFGRMTSIRQIRPAVEALRRMEAKMPRLPRVKAPPMMPGARIIRLKDQPKLLGVSTKKEKKKVKHASFNEKKRNMLPRPQYLKAMEELKLKQPIAPVIITAPGAALLSVPSPKVWWVYRIFQKIKWLKK